MRDLDPFLFRMAVQKNLRNSLEKLGYTEVSTSVMSVFAGTDPEIEPVKSMFTPLMGHDLKKTQLFLHTSPEFEMKKLLCRGMKAIYQICPVFRQGELGSLHSPEFTMAEWYRVGLSVDQLINEVEEIVCQAADEIKQTGKKVINLNPPFPRKSFFDACREARVDTGSWDELSPFEWQENFQRQMVDKIDQWAEKQGVFFLTDFPKNAAVLSAINEKNENVADRFELYINGYEIANGCRELTDPDEHNKRFLKDIEFRKKLGKLSYPLPEGFLEYLKNPGLPECSGVAVGIERLAMALAGEDKVEGFRASKFGAV